MNEDELIMACLEVQYVIISDLADELNRMPTREEVEMRMHEEQVGAEQAQDGILQIRH